WPAPRRPPGSLASTPSPPPSDRTPRHSAPDAHRTLRHAAPGAHRTPGTGRDVGRRAAYGPTVPVPPGVIDFANGSVLKLCPDEGPRRLGDARAPSPLW